MKISDDHYTLFTRVQHTIIYCQKSQFFCSATSVDVFIQDFEDQVNQLTTSLVTSISRNGLTGTQTEPRQGDSLLHGADVVLGLNVSNH